VLIGKLYGEKMLNYQPRVLDLFSGIGGFSLGLERAGFRTEAFCEIDVKAREVLAKHWPNVPIFNDVSKLTKEVLDERGITIDVICGGFPCQDISAAGKGAGLGGERSGLWWQFHRLIEECRPQFAIIENVSALRGRGLDEMLRGLATIGYDAEWHCIPAASIGAPHRRDRIWIVAYPMRWGCQNSGPEPAYLNAGSMGSPGVWERRPDAVVCGVGHGIPGWVDRIKQLGNAVVPQIPELIGRSIVQSIFEPANDNWPAPMQIVA
jgi:DNA (cytosine-5)-methyltransferase 1